MSDIRVEKNPARERLEALGIYSWPTWTKEPSTFPWTYDEPETCYFLEGEVVVTPQKGPAVQIGKGDLVVFPSGLSCTWEVRKAVKKHYRFG